MAKPTLRARLLDWYDANARVLPWRVSPAARGAGARADPYRVWLSEVMLQQTTVPHATAYFLKFLERWPSVGALAAAPDDVVMAAWAGLGYYARARNLLACARAVAGEHGGVFPASEEGLRALPGVGGYTAAAIAAIAFDQPANVVDGNVERVVARLYAVETPLPAAKPEITRLAARLAEGPRPGDWAQALMDLGSLVCRPKAPLCDRCPLARGLPGAGAAARRRPIPDVQRRPIARAAAAPPSCWCAGARSRWCAARQRVCSAACSACRPPRGGPRHGRRRKPWRRRRRRRRGGGWARSNTPSPTSR